jgi:Ca2+/Na+ antiporter
MNLALIFMVAISLVSLVFMITRTRVVRWEGIVLLAAYAAAMPILFL